MDRRDACAQGDNAHDAGDFPVCPSCGDGDAITSNRIDETAYRDAARSAGALREIGAVHLAADLLTSLASVRIINFVRMKYRCACGAQFDN